jgi:membrane protease YdiL (CAAX protease family)
MAAHRLKFAVFVVSVLVPSGALMAARDPQLVQLGELVMILSPAIAGAVLNLGLGDRGRRTRWPWVGLAMVVTLLVALGALAMAWVGGAASFRPSGLAPAGVLAQAGASALTSVLEELGWAGGGLALAVKAMGRRWGVLTLGLVWAAWHLIPTFLNVGLFPELEAAPPAMLAAFVVACLIYRDLLTGLRERADSWMAAAAAHAAPNILLSGLAAAGLGLFERPEAWPLFPAPGGLVFPLLALVALLVLRRVAPRGLS